MKKIFTLVSALLIRLSLHAGIAPTDTLLLAEAAKNITADSLANGNHLVLMEPADPYHYFSAKILVKSSPEPDGVLAMNLGDINLFFPVTQSGLQSQILGKITVNMNGVEKHFDAIAHDSLRAAIPLKMPQDITLLKQQIGLVYNDTLKAKLFQKIADHYLNYDSITIRRTRQYYQDAAIEFTMKALHSYSRTTDGNGIRLSYDNLVKVYRDQKKFPQAKWFVLQSNTLSRNLNDTPNIIASLLVLADIKMAIKDNSLAMRDLNEALALSSKNHYSKQEAAVQTSFANLYNRLNKPQQATLAMKRHDAIEDSIIKASDSTRVALVIAQDSSVLAKKKLYTSVGKKPFKTNSFRKIASL